jgi:hypothetical protein
MAAKQKSDKSNADAPASAPELTDEQKQKIEAELTLNTPKSQEKEMVEESKTVTGEELTGDDVAAEVPAAGSEPNRLRRILSSYWRRKRWTIPVTLLAILGLLAGIPATRYALAAYVVDQPVSVTVTDNATKKPVTSADVTLEGKVYKTDKDGKVTIQDVKVGDRKLTVSKKYYKDTTVQVFVPLSGAVSSKVAMVATGRQVPVTVVNKVSGKPLENATLKSAGTEVKTDKDGKAVIVLPADKADLPISLSNGGFNALEARVKVTDQTVKENTFALTPGGKVYFLSRQSGKIDVVKTDLDGGSRQVVVQATGKEEDRGTVLLASRDWKYLALLSKRDSGLPKLYLIDTASDKMIEMDSGDATFSLVGWDDHTFVYQVTRTKLAYTDANKTAFKSFNADKKQLVTIDQTAATNENGILSYQSFGSGSLIDHKLAYTVSWQSNYYGQPTGKAHSLRVASIDSANKKEVKTWPVEQYSAYPQSLLYAPGELYIGIYANNSNKQLYYEYEDGAIKDADIDDSKFQSPYPTFLASPDNKRAFWSEQRDGRETFFVGDASGDNGKQVAVEDDGQVFGWYSDDYLLLSKKGSELYIMSVAGGATLKVADYHKPQLSYRGYGGGYGGL